MTTWLRYLVLMTAALQPPKPNVDHTGVLHVDRWFARGVGVKNSTALVVCCIVMAIRIYICGKNRLRHRSPAPCRSPSGKALQTVWRRSQWRPCIHLDCLPVGWECRTKGLLAYFIIMSTVGKCGQDTRSPRLLRTIHRRENLRENQGSERRKPIRNSLRHLLSAKRRPNKLFAPALPSFSTWLGIMN